jgi:murein DD-endopeptidase MepM/ murein hydrolase activator NlpD
MNAPLSILRISIGDMVRLRVRTRGRGNAPLPDYLYQRLPAAAMSLMATLPHGDFAVSIPHENGLGKGYPIIKSSPPPADGFVVVYAKQENGRYEAINARFYGKAYDVADFQEFACHWVEEHHGQLRDISGRYAYFAPTIDLWGAVLRDNGFIAVDLFELPPDDIPELSGNRLDTLSAGIIARAPLQAGNKQPYGSALPAFARVEVASDSRPGLQSTWINFAEYQKARLVRARPPDSIIPDFLQWLSRLTAESGFTRWVFRGGMLFGDRIEWWKDCVRRRTEHEGIDFAEGSRPGENIKSVPRGTTIRAIADGEIVGIMNDFLGKTVVIRHQNTDETDAIFYTLLSHIQPHAGRGDFVAGGQIIGEIGVSTNAGVPAHLHLSGAWIPRTIHPGEIGMNHIHPAFSPIVLVNFNDFIPESLYVRRDRKTDQQQR